MKESMEEWLYFNNVKYSVEKNPQTNIKLSKQLYELAQGPSISSNPQTTGSDTQITNPVAKTATGSDTQITAPVAQTPPVGDTQITAPVAQTPPVGDTQITAPVTTQTPPVGDTQITAPVTTQTPPVGDTQIAAPVTTQTPPVGDTQITAPTAQTPVQHQIIPVVNNTVPTEPSVAPAGGVGAYLRNHPQNNNPIPANDGSARYNQGVIDPQGSSWRQNYGGIAPGFFHKSAVAASGTVPTGTETQQPNSTFNPNQNGSQPNGPAWKPPTTQPGWDTPSPHTNNNQAQKQQFSLANQLINSSLLPRTSYAGNLVGGGIGGVLGAGPLPWTLNKLTDFTISHTKADSFAAKGANFYKRNLNPKAFMPEKFKEITAQIAEKDAQILDIKTATNDALTNLKQIEPSNLTRPQEDQINLLETKLKLLNDNNFTTVNDAAKQLKIINDNVRLNPDLFTKDELKLLTSREDLRVNAAEISDGFKDSTSFLGASSVKGLAGNFIKGAAFAGLAMSADDYLDRAITGKSHKEASALYDGLLLPAAFAAPTWGSRAAYAAAGIAGSLVLDKLLPASDKQEFSKLLRPTTLDSLAMGAAFLIPAESTAVRLSLIGGAWAMGRVYNLIQGDGNIGLKTNAVNALNADSKERSASSMNKAIAAFKNLGDTSLSAVNLSAQELNSNPSTSLPVVREQAIVDTAYGESLLKQGSMVPDAKTPQYLLPGYNLDLGGRAMRYLMLADNKYQQAAQISKLELGQNINGKVVTQSEISSLAQADQSVKDIINNKINGSHDINKIFAKLENLAYIHPGQTAKLILKNQDWIAKLGQNEPQLTAKLFRDLALIELAAAAKDIGYNGIGKATSGSTAEAALALYGSNEARQAQDANGNPKGYSGALDCLKLANKLDPQNPDLPALVAIANNLQAKIPANSITNLQSSVANPLGA